jgi:subtilisin family serine protease/PKD repeat protein
LIVLLIIFSFGIHSAAGLMMPDNEVSNDQKLNVELGEANEVTYESALNPMGYVFPGNLEVKELSGTGVDTNQNGIEDFIDHHRESFEDSKYINTVITLTEPITDNLIQELKSFGCIINHRSTLIDALGVSIPVGRLDSVGALPGVELIESVRLAKPSLNAAVPLTKASQDKLKNNGYNGITGEGVTIAIIDSGIDGDHNTFNTDRIIAFRDFYQGNSDLDPTDGMDAVDYESHGTACASCAAGSGTYKGSAIGAYLIGVAVQSTYDMLVGIEWCVNNRNKDFTKDGVPDGPDIISLSMGVQGTSNYLDNTAGSAMDNGVIFVTSAGNDGPNPGTVTSPATSAKVIGVGSTNKYNKQISSFSSRGPGPGGIIKPDIVAPGENIIIAAPNNRWVQGSGTSFSAPIVAGIAALILQYDPDLDPYEVKNILLTSAEDRGTSGPDNDYGYGFVDTIAALDMVLKVKSIVPSETNVIEDTSVSFTASTSGQNIVKFEWDFDGDLEFDKTTTGGTTNHIYTKQGTYDIIVKITNERGKSAEASVQVQVTNRKPDAKLDVEVEDSQEILYEDDPITFNGSRSWDTPSDINLLEFSWSFDGGLNFTNFSKEQKRITHKFNKSGEYTVIMKVQDDDQEQDDKFTTLSVQNLKPKADAGEDIIAYEEEVIKFSAIDTYDTESDLPLLTYNWDFGDGTMGTGMNQTHSYTAERDNKTFEVTLTVNDDDGSKDKTEILVTVQNKPPSVAMIKDVYGLEDEEVTLGGIGNDSISDRELLQYKWIFGDGNKSTWLNSAYTTHTYTMMGTYHAKLLVKDPKGAVTTGEVNVTISNVKPKADFSMDKVSATEDELVEFDASGSTDSESDIDDLYYIWDFGDGTIGMGKTIKHRYYNSYKYTIILTVKDDDSEMALKTKQLIVENRKPEAKISIDAGDNQVNELVKFFGYKSTDTPSDRYNLSYQWDFGDGKHSSGVNATHRYSEPGEYKIRLRVVDDDGISDEMRAKLVIEEEVEEEDMFANPTVENNGVYVYSGIVVLVFVLLFILISLFMVYKGKKTVIGKLRASSAERKRKKEEERTAAELGQGTFDQRIDGTSPMEYQFQSGAMPNGLTPEQENYFQQMYGIPPENLEPGQGQNQGQEYQQYSQYPQNSQYLQQSQQTTTPTPGGPQMQMTPEQFMQMQMYQQQMQMHNIPPQSDSGMQMPPGPGAPLLPPGPGEEPQKQQTNPKHELEDDWE